MTPKERAEFWEKKLKPGRLAEDGSRDYMINPFSYFKADQSQLRSRASTMFWGGSGYKRESFMNSLGLLTKAQKNNYKNFSKAEMEKAVKGGVKQSEFTELRNKNNKPYFRRHMGTPVMTSALNRGFALSQFMQIGKDGAYMSDTFSTIAAISGSQIGLGIGLNLGGSMAKGTAGRAALGLAGGVLGTLSGAAVAYGVVAGASGSMHSDNWAIKAAQKLRPKDRLEVGFSQDQAQHVSQRQRIMSKLSKSALNDRGQFMGNEAMALRGVI